MIRRIISIILSLGMIFGAYQITLSDWAKSHRDKYITIHNEKGEEVTTKELRDMYLQAKKTKETLKIFEETVYGHYTISGKVMITDNMSSACDNKILLSSARSYSNYDKGHAGFCLGDGKSALRGLYIYASEEDAFKINSNKKLVFSGVIINYDDNSMAIGKSMVFSND